MKAKIQFGSLEPKRVVDYPHTVKEFPRLVLYKGMKFEFAVYTDDPEKECDYFFYFEEVRGYDPNWYATTYEFVDSYFSDQWVLKCDCGAKDSEGHFNFCQTRKKGP